MDVSNQSKPWGRISLLLKFTLATSMLLRFVQYIGLQFSILGGFLLWRSIYIFLKEIWLVLQSIQLMLSLCFCICSILMGMDIVEHHLSKDINVSLHHLLIRFDFLLNLFTIFRNVLKCWLVCRFDLLYCIYCFVCIIKAFFMLDN